MLWRSLSGASSVFISFVASSIAEASNANATITINKPTGVVDGDLMIAAMCGGQSAATWTGATGWTEVADQGATPNLRIAYKIAASEGANYTFTASANVNKAAVIVAYRNASYSNIGTFGTSTAQTAVVAPSISVAADNSVLIACFGTRNGTTFSTPSGMTNRGSINTTVNPALYVFDRSIGAGSTGNISSTPTTGSDNSGILLSIRPL